MANQLVHYDEFAEILDDYQPSEGSLSVLGQTSLTLLTAPSAVGRNTIINKLVETGGYHDALTDTTRQPRVNDGTLECNGVEYYFKTEVEFLDGLRGGEYLEAAIIHEQQVSGLHVDELQRTNQREERALADVDILGIEHYQALKPDGHYIFVVPPTFEEWLHRMTNRGRLDQDEIHRRLSSAEVEFQHALDHDYYAFVINDELNRAVNEVDAIARGEVAPEQAAIRESVWQLLNELKRKLYS